MADFNTFFDRVLGRANQDPTVFRKDGSEISIRKDGSVSIKSAGSVTLAGPDTSFALKHPALTLNAYQTGALTTAVYADQWKVIYPALKLTGEAGEVSEKIGKNIRDGDGTYSDEFKKELAKELGDVLWYIAALGRDIGYTLEEIGQMNLDKLASRKARNVISGSGDNR